MRLIMQIIPKLHSLIRGKSYPLASNPREFTLQDWKHALKATVQAIATKRINILATGIAYFAIFAFFPLVAASVAIASMVISYSQLEMIVTSVRNFLPADIASLLTSQLQTAHDNQSASLLVAIIGILIALFSISGAVTNLMSASNAIYERTETRSFIKLRLTSLGLLASGFVIGLVTIGLLALDTQTLQMIGLSLPIALVLAGLRWVVITIVVTIALAIFYRYSPDRPNPKWQWVSWGAIIAALLWLMGTVAFFIYARYFADFSESYSTFAGIIALMMWFNLSSFIVLLGGEINYRLENQTLQSTVKK